MFAQSFTKNTALPYYTYDQRGLLRNWSPQDGAQVLVDSLGMFVYSNSSTQVLGGNNVNTYQAVDDDESCFLTGNGAWLLEYPHWDVVNNWMLPDIEALYSTTYYNGQAKFYPIGTTNRVGFLFATATSTVTSISPQSQVTQAVTVSGASVGDYVFVVPPNNMDGNGRATIFAIVTATNTVTIYYQNPVPAASASLTAGTLRIVVMKNY
jgi:hypothetical protein